MICKLPIITMIMLLYPPQHNNPLPPLIEWVYDKEDPTIFSTHTNHIELRDAILLHGEWQRNSILFDQHCVLCSFDR